jgi:hypothetical protein
MITAFFWVITYRRVVIPYLRRFGTNYRPHLGFLAPENGSDKLFRNVARIYHYSLLNSPEERSPHKMTSSREDCSHILACTSQSSWLEASYRFLNNPWPISEMILYEDKTKRLRTYKNDIILCSNAFVGFLYSYPSYCCVRLLCIPTSRLASLGQTRGALIPTKHVSLYHYSILRS